MAKRKTKEPRAESPVKYHPPVFTRIFIRSQWQPSGEVLHDIDIDGDDVGSANSLGGLLGLLEPMLTRTVARKLSEGA
jgi:hypothetical protein